MSDIRSFVAEHLPLRQIISRHLGPVTSSVVWRVLLLAQGSAAAFAVTEWLFQATKPSALVGLSWSAHAIALTQSILAYFLVTSTAVPFALILPRARVAWLRAVLWIGALAMPSILLAATLLLLIDNFTYTLWRFGLLTSSGIVQGGYAGLLLILLFASAKWALTFAAVPRSGYVLRIAVISALTGLGLTAVLSMAILDFDGDIPIQTAAGRAAARPNIVIVGSDGLLADHMSAYGYVRETTPEIDRWIQQALVAANAFANADKTHASVGSLLSGKHPLRTGVVRTGQSFQGQDVYTHAIGMFRRAGYYNVTLGVRAHGDPLVLNLKNGFDLTAGMEPIRITPVLDALRHAGLITLTTEALLRESVTRIGERFLHAIGIIDAENPYRLVTNAKAMKLSNADRHVAMLDVLGKVPEPFLVHVHYMSTHGPRFALERRIFSAGKVQTRDWMPDFYDDAVLDFDSRFHDVLEVLTQRGVLDRTVVALYADHGIQRTSDERVPLAIRFPGGAHAGRFHGNAQLLDVPATLLDYVNIDKPDWLGGRSWLSDPYRGPRDPIWVVHSSENGSQGLPGARNEGRRSGSLSVVYCDWVHELLMASGKTISRRVGSHTSPCGVVDVPSREEAHAALLREVNDWGASGTP